jgi:hypothetical protein
MPTETTNAKNAASDAASRMTDKISDAASAAQSTAADFGRNAVAKVDENRDAAARGLATVADTIRHKADRLSGGETVTGIAHTAADQLSSTAEYVREHDVSSMLGDLQRLVKNNPGQSLLAAAAIGFLVGRMFAGRD